MRLRSEISQLGRTIHLLKQSGRDSAATELLITQKRAELDDLSVSARPAR
jgi:hypothetical protein